MKVVICKGCGIGFETKRSRQKFHSYGCYVEYKMRTDPLWIGGRLDIIDRQAERYKAVKEIEKAQRNKDQGHDSQAGNDKG